MRDEDAVMARGPAPATEMAPPYKLYSTTAVVVASLLGSPIAGGIVMAIDLARLGRKREAWKWLVLTSVGTALLVAIAWWMPSTALRRTLRIDLIILVATLLAMARAARHTLGPALTGHAAAGGRQASTWAAAGIGAACLAVLGLGLGALTFLTPPFPGRLVAVQGTEVYVSGGATEAEGVRVGEFLLEAECMLPGSGAQVHLERTTEGYAIDLVYDRKTLRDPELVAWLRDLGARLRDLGFGPRLDLRLCNELLEVEETIALR